MSKIKVILTLGFSLCVFGLLILGLIGLSQSRNPNPNRKHNGNLTKTSESPLTGPFQIPTSPAPEGDPDREISDPQSITSCSVAMEILPSPRPTKQWIYPHKNSTKVEVLCDFQVDGGGWTLIQKRNSGPREDFNRTWTEYSNGFGSLNGNFWLGLENIHALTKNGDQELRIELEDFDGEKVYAKYSNFSISDASDFYRLSISGFSGNAGDSMAGLHNMHHEMKFTTKDKDNDLSNGSNCLDDFGGGAWWFNACGYSNLNGRYLQKGEMESKGIFWANWKGHFYSLAKTEMKIRPRKSESV